MNFACSCCALLGLVASLVGCGSSPPGIYNGHGGSAGVTGGSAGAAGGSAGSSGGVAGSAGAGGLGGSSAGSAGDSSGTGASAGVAGAAASGGQSGVAGSAGSMVGGGAGSAGSSGGAGSGGVAGSGGGAGSAGKAGAAGAAGSAGAGGSAGNAGATLGQACVNDAECGGAPLICLLQTSTGWGVGAPPQGLCTLPCSQNGTCSAVAPGAACYKPGASGYCLEGCVIGSAGAADKCHARAEFACAEFTQGAGTTVDLCMPSCNGDLDCGGGTFCDPSSGMCLKTPKAGDPEGTPCDPAGVNTCKGICLTLSATAAVCADGCTTGAACRYDASNVAHGACLGQFALTDPLATSDLGDYGWCVETCACGADCDFSGDSCDAWQGTAAQVSALTQAFGNPGLCVPQPTMPLTVCQ